jgi:HD superfamily phosphohydrolase
MLKFVDILYGSVELPDWALPFIKLPEFIRLRGVRLSNVDSVYFKDFSGPTRWEHGISVAALAYRCANKRGLTDKERVQLTLAGLLHDVGTPPFAHTAESVLANFDHEIEGQRLLGSRVSQDFAPDSPIFQSQLPQFHRACDRLSRELRLSVDPDEIAKYISGEGDLGFLINGPIDLDNADNVTRSSLFLGLKVDAEVPLHVTDWLASQESIATNLDGIEDQWVKKWVSYRDQLYTVFFEADEGELARTAFLQYLMRRGLDAGLERSQLIWATDDELMNLIARLEDTAADDFRPSLKELVQRYRLLETPTCLVKISIEDITTLRVLRHPDAVAWITRRLRADGFEPIVLVLSRRFPSAGPRTLFSEPAGTLLVFQLGNQPRLAALTSRLRAEITGRLLDSSSANAIQSLFSTLIHTWCAEKPWSAGDATRRRNVTAALKSIGDWGFRLSRNDGFHAYPSTFVHALPANLLVSLGVKDDLVLDPFGGTGQTAVEALKYGNSCVTADVSSIASLVAKAQFTYMPPATRERIRKIDDCAILAARCVEPPDCDLLAEWFDSKTRCELGRIMGFVQDMDDSVVQTFLRACISAILPSCTARRGEQHGYFADNCPLPSGVSKPPYQPAVKFFLDKTHQALARVERLYGFIERQGRNPESELTRVDVRQVDVTTATAESYGLHDGEVGAIITSPPYLCMADYALGQRLSYEWLYPNQLGLDFKREIGARRLRLKRKPDATTSQYYEALKSFAALAGRLVRKGGYLAIVIGQPVAKEYRNTRVLARLDEFLHTNGFEPLWQTDRVIHWHRNHGYARLKKERISVHLKT